MKNRLFVALDIPDEIINRIITIRDLSYSDAPPKWEKKNKLHITLKFFGEVESNLESSIISILDNSIKEIDKFKLEFEKFGLFYRGKNPSILWCGLKKSEVLFEFVKKLDAEFHKLGFKKDFFRFKPHLTLLRFRGYENLELIKKFMNYNIENISFDASLITLYKSDLNPDGSIYTILKRFEI